MNENLLKSLVFIIAVGFSQRITNKTYKALAKIRRLSAILIVPKTHVLSYQNHFHIGYQLIACGFVQESGFQSGYPITLKRRQVFYFIPFCRK
jgi:hypothetical protein